MIFCDVGDPNMELVMTSCDEAALLVVKCVAYRYSGVSSIEMGS